VTVQGEDSPVADVDLDAAAEQFTDIYRECAGRLFRFVWRRLDISDSHLADDLTSETFIALWRRYMLKGVAIHSSAYGLLCTLARWQIAEYYAARANKEMALDVGDPVNTPLIVTGHAYASDRPELAALVSELDAAMEHMTDASTAWRQAHKASNRAQRLELTNDNLLVDYQDDGVDVLEDETLNAFREACAEVGRVRAELEAVAGPHWRSTLPPPTGKDGSAPARGYAGRKAAPRTKTAADLKREAGVEKARAMLLDPDCTLTRAEIAAECGIAVETIKRRLCAENTIRHRRETNAIDSVLLKARALLLDPDCTLTLEEVARKVGTASKAIREALPDAVEENRRLEAVRGASPPY